jgi:hypothetical protein
MKRGGDHMKVSIGVLIGVFIGVLPTWGLLA